MKTICKHCRSIQLVLGRTISLRFGKDGYFMKITTFVGLCIALCASFFSARADNTQPQTADPAALEQKLNNTENSQTPPTSVSGIPSEAMMVLPGEFATNVTETVPAKVVAPQIAPAAAVPAAEASTNAA